MSKETSLEFWKNTTEYPNFGNIKERRLYEINYLIPRLHGESILDLGCGDGSLLNCLINLIDSNSFYGFDISKNMLNNLNKSIKKQVFDFYNYKKSDLPTVSDVILAGSLQYVFDDNTILKLLADLKTKKVFIRSACTLTNERLVVNNFSKILNKNYSSIYRTVPEMIDLISKSFKIESIDRIYPDNIESKFETKQFYFVGTKI